MISPVLIRNGDTVIANDGISTVNAYDQDTRISVQSAIARGSAVSAQTKTVEPSESTQVIVPDTGYNYLSKVTVLAIDVMTSEEITAAVTAGWEGE